MAAAQCAFLDTLPDTDSLPFGATITLRSNPAHPGAITARAAPNLLRSDEFAEADTTLGLVNVGYTDEAQLAFTFAYTNDTYLLPIVEVFCRNSSLPSSHARPIWSRPHKPARLM